MECDRRVENIRAVGQELRQLREQIGLSLRQMAPLIPIDFSLLSKIERGRSPAPSDVIKVYVGRAGIDESTAEITVYKLELLSGRAPFYPMSEFEADMLAAIMGVLRKRHPVE